MFHCLRFFAIALALLSLPKMSIGQVTPFLDEDDNDIFAFATVLAPEIRTLSGDYGFSFGEFFPDTVLGVFDEFGNLLDTDDDGSAFGDGTASGLVAFGNADGTLRLKVSGIADFDFDGLDDGTGLPHQEVGEIDIQAVGTIPGDPNDPNDPDVEFFDFDSGFLEAGEVLEFLFEDDELAELLVFVDIDNEFAPQTRVDFRDFYRFTGLTPGALFIAETAEIENNFDDLDTILAQFDESGEIVELNDDFNDEDFLSQIRGTVPASGEVVLAVTGFDDFDFVSEHDEFGSYRLTLTQVPEPASASLFFAIFIGLANRRLRKRS